MYDKCKCGEKKHCYEKRCSDIKRCATDLTICRVINCAYPIESDSRYACKIHAEQYVQSPYGWHGWLSKKFGPK